MEPLRVMSVFGTRPCAIKMAPVLMELAKYCNSMTSQVVVTGQHREMLDQVLDLFGIKPDYDLNIMKREQTLSYITKSILEKIDGVLDAMKPDIVLVHGDTPTAFVAAMAAFYRRIPVAHVEAGLRSYDKYDPFPEEMNRRLIDALCDYYFAPTTRSKQNILKENLPKANIFVTGNTAIDALFAVTARALSYDNKDLEKIDFKNRKIILVETHRRESWGETLQQIFQALRELVVQYPDVEVVFPVHLNPKIQRPAWKILGNQNRIHLLAPLSYKDFTILMKQCFFIMTDSGGLQEEGPALGKPVLVLRKTTERPEGIEAGTLKLTGVKREDILKEASLLLDDRSEYEKMARAVNPYGDGKAAKRIVQAIRYKFGQDAVPPTEFMGVGE